MTTGTGREACRTLWDALGEIPDRRGRKGRQYPLRSVLCLTLAALVSGADDPMAVFRWGRRLPAEALGRVGLTRAPCHATCHYLFKALDVDAAERALGARARGDEPPGHVAIDGKRLRGSAPAGHDGREGVHLVAAFAGRPRAVVGQARVGPGASEAATALAPPGDLPLAGSVVTGDAAFRQRAIRRAIRERGGDHPFTVKANQPRLMADIAVAFGDAFPPGADRGPG